MESIDKRVKWMEREREKAAERNEIYECAAEKSAVKMKGTQNDDNNSENDDDVDNDDDNGDADDDDNDKR